MKVLVTGAAGNAGLAICPLLASNGFTLRMADIGAPPPVLQELGEYLRCDTRSPGDVRRALCGVEAVVHLAAWHCGHQPPVSDATIFAVNVHGSYNLIEACREQNIQSLVFGSSMAWGHGDVYALTKVLGEELCTAYHHWTGAAVAMLRYHCFLPGPYLEVGARLLRNGVDRQDVARATLAALQAAVDGRIGLFRSIVHTRHRIPEPILADFARRGPDHCEAQRPGARALIEKYGIDLPGDVERHDLGEARRLIGWEPQVGFLEFLGDLQRREAEGQDPRSLIVPGEIPRPA